MSVSVPVDDPGQHPTEAVLGYTTSLQRGEGAEIATATYEDVGEVTDLTAWDASRDSVEVTNHRSPGFSIENIPGLIDWGSASFELNAVPRYLADPETPQGSLLDDFKSAGNTPWRIVFPDGTWVGFLAALTSYQLTAPVKDVMKGSFELKISGSPEFFLAEQASDGNGTQSNGGAMLDDVAA
jgi:Lambda phage tail tube protein, TTP